MTLRDGEIELEPTASGASEGRRQSIEKGRLPKISPSRKLIRNYASKDLEFIKEVHRVNGLDDRCLPNLDDPLFIIKRVLEHEGQPAMASLQKGTVEIFLFVDHSQGTPAERWEWLKQLTEDAKRQAWLKGLDSLTCWVPAEVEKSFEKRLEDLGFVKSPWQSYTLCLNER